MELNKPVSPIISYGTYPFLGLVLAALAVLIAQGRLDAASVAGPWMLGPALLLIVLEWRLPLKPEWRMTKQTFWRRDIKYVIPFVVLGIIAKPVAAFVALRLMSVIGAGPLASLPLWAQVAAGILMFDLLWYHYHRFAHSNGRLWRSHAAHHSAPQLYVVMHLLFHPIDALMVELLLPLAVFRLTGMSVDAAASAVMIQGLQGVVGHTNLDLRFGPLNYLLMTTETHRYHHSAMPEEFRQLQQHDLDLGPAFRDVHL
ncbi:MAG TPA: sterol desaturase family protein [Chloroflexota bacterium]|nr:sterol desaturase family protein [Chloroflexota bacterium]